MTVKLVGSTSGSVSLQAPASTSGGANRVLTLPDKNGTVATTSDSFGKILQVVQVVKKDTFTVTGQTFADLPGFNPSITPAATGSKIMLDISLSGNSTGQGAIDLYRSIGGGAYTQLTDFIGDAASNAYRTTMSLSLIHI